MPRSCIVPFCSHRGPIKDLRFYRITESRREDWLRAIGRGVEEDIGKDSSICSAHFEHQDFKENSQVLKDGVVPSRKLRPIDIRKQTFRQRFGQQNVEIPSPSNEGEDPLLILPQPGTTDRELAAASPVEEIATEEHIKIEWMSDDASSTSTCFSDKSGKRKRHQAFQSASDKEGLTGSLERRRSLFRLMHHYAKSPRKLAQAVTDLKDKNNQLQMNLCLEKRRVGRLKRRIEHLRNTVSELQRLRVVSGTAQEILKEHDRNNSKKFTCTR